MSPPSPGEGSAPSKDRSRALLSGLASWFALLLIALAVPAPAQEARPSPVTLGRADNLARVNGRPTALLWAEGLTEAADLPAYRDAGLNTLYVTISDASAAALDAADALIKTAEGDGLYIVIGLRPSSLENVALSALDSSQADTISRFVTAVTGRWKDEPLLVGYVIDAVDPRRVLHSDAAFQAYLRTWYGDISALNLAWPAAFRSFDAVSVVEARRLDLTKPGNFGRPTVDIGRYRAAVYADLLSAWVERLAGADSRHFTLAGRASDFRSLITVPESYSGIVTEVLPNATNPPDLQTHQVQAVDIARRGNSKLVIAGLDVTQGPERLVSWTAEAFLHGAAGIAYLDWPTLRANPGALAQVKQAVDSLVGSGLFPRASRARAAILYEPFAGGRPGANGVPLYGYLPDLAWREPSSFIELFQRGSRFGQMDYLAVDTLVRASSAGGEGVVAGGLSVNLSQYGVIFAPLAFYLPDAAQQALRAFVQGGGVLVADLGVGFYQGVTGTMTSIPPALAAPLGVSRVAEIDYRAINMAVWSPHPLFPSLQPGEVTTGQHAGAAFAGLVGHPFTLPGAIRFMGRPRRGTPVPAIVVNQYGRGYGVFVPARMWEDWQFGDGLYAEFYGDLLRVGRSLDRYQPPDLPGVPEVAYYLNPVPQRGAEGPAARVPVVGLFSGGGEVRVAVANAQNTVFLGGVEGGLLAQLVRPPGTNAFSRFIYGSSGLTLAFALPLTVSTDAGELGIIAAGYDRKGVKLRLYGPGPTVNATVPVTLEGGSAARATFTLRPGLYRVSPNSSHTITLVPTTGQNAPPAQTVQADDKGVLTFSVEVPAGGATVTVTPAA